MEKLAVAVIPEQYFALFSEAVQHLCGGKQIVFSGRGTAGTALLQRLGLGSGKKNIIGFFTCIKTIHEIRSLWEKAAAEHNDCGGILFTLLTENKTMVKKTEHTLICIIVNSGYAEPVMQAARKAGASGGTIIEAKGTGMEQDMNFFGIQIVPEKEVVLIVSKADTAPRITDEIKKLPCFDTPASGIVCTLSVDSCFHLGPHPV